MFLNSHSAAELVELLATKDQLHRELGNSFEAFRAQWAQADPQTFTKFSDDYQANLHKYQQTREQIVAKIAEAHASIRPMTAFPVEAEWKALLLADQAVPSTLSDGDLADLQRRIAAAAAAAKVALPKGAPLAQPKAEDAGVLASLIFEPTAVLSTGAVAVAADAGQAAVHVAQAAEQAVLKTVRDTVDAATPKLAPATVFALSAGTTAVLCLAGWAAARALTKPLR